MKSNACTNIMFYYTWAKNISNNASDEAIEELATDILRFASRKRHTHNYVTNKNTTKQESYTLPEWAAYSQNMLFGDSINENVAFAVGTALMAVLEDRWFERKYAVFMHGAVALGPEHAYKRYRQRIKQESARMFKEYRKRNAVQQPQPAINNTNAGSVSCP